VVLSEPLNGELQERKIIGGMGLHVRSEASSMGGIDAERERHRVSPKTTPIHRPVIFHLLLKGYFPGKVFLELQKGDWKIRGL
jgi:hypothetical protein